MDEIEIMQVMEIQEAEADGKVFTEIIVTETGSPKDVIKKSTCVDDDIPPEHIDPKIQLNAGIR